MSSVNSALKTKAHVIPFAIFMVGLLLLPAAEGLIGHEHQDAAWWRRDVAQWIYPIQVLACGGALAYFWKQYEFNLTGAKLLFGLLMGVVGIGLWLLPTVLFDRMGFADDEAVPRWLSRLGVASRSDGFNPAEVFEAGGGAYWSAVVLRLIRAAVIVAFVEEIFWRGFLMRYVMNPDKDFWKEPFGRPAMRSFVIVTLAFVAIHSPVDYPAALIYGSMTYWVTIKTKSLGAVVAMHLMANLLMGIFAISYGKYGLW